MGKRRMLTALALLAVPVAAAAQPTAAPGVSMAQLVGRYEFHDRDGSAAIDLRADGSFSYRVDLPGSAREKAERTRWDGRWRTRSANKIVLENAPGAAEFLLRGNSIDLAAGLIEVEAGQVGIPMRKTGPARPPSP